MKMTLSADAAAHLCAIITVLFWGTTFVSTKVLLTGFKPIEILMLRFILGFIVLSVFNRQKRIRNPKTEWMYAAAGLSGITLYFLLENIALTFTYASIVGVAVCTAPFFTALLALVFLKTEKPRITFFAGFLIAMCGIALVSFTGTTIILTDAKGIILSLLAAVVWGVYSILLKKIGSEGYSAITVTRAVFFYGILFMIPALFIFGVTVNPSENLIRFSNPVFLLNLLYLGIGASAVCFATWSYSVKRLGAIKTSVYIYLSPVITLIFSAIILKEPLTSHLIAGAILTLTGLVISEWRFPSDELRRNHK